MRRRVWLALMPEVVFTDLSSLAYKLALVAAGRFDGLISRRTTHDWDVAAAQLLITEAGGRLSGIDGSPLVLEPAGAPSPRPRSGGTGALHRALLERLSEQRAGPRAPSDRRVGRVPRFVGVATTQHAKPKVNPASHRALEPE